MQTRSWRSTASTAGEPRYNRIRASLNGKGSPTTTNGRLRTQANRTISGDCASSTFGSEQPRRPARTWRRAKHNLRLTRPEIARVKADWSLRDIRQALLVRDPPMSGQQYWAVSPARKSLHTIEFLAANPPLRADAISLAFFRRPKAMHIKCML